MYFLIDYHKSDTPSPEGREEEKEHIMGNKQPQPPAPGAASWSGIAKSSQDARPKEGTRFALHSDPVQTINTSRMTVPANVVLSSLKYMQETLHFEFIATEPCAIGIHVDDVLVKGKELSFPAGKHNFSGALALTETSILAIVLREQRDNDDDGPSSTTKRALKITCRLKGHDRLVVLGKQADIAGRVVDLEEVYGISGGEECVVCISERPSTTLLPCRHMCACEECASFLMRMIPGERKCPVCRGLISSTIKVSTAPAS